MLMLTLWSSVDDSDVVLRAASWWSSPVSGERPDHSGCRTDRVWFQDQGWEICVPYGDGIVWDNQCMIDLEITALKRVSNLKTTQWLEVGCTHSQTSRLLTSSLSLDPSALFFSLSSHRHHITLFSKNSGRGIRIGGGEEFRIEWGRTTPRSPTQFCMCWARSSVRDWTTTQYLTHFERSATPWQELSTDTDKFMSTIVVHTRPWIIPYILK
jgi:hypothetical protein